MVNCRLDQFVQVRAGTVPVMGEQLSPAQRDALIVRLRAEGWSIRRIARRAGCSPNGVHTALERIGEGRPGRDRRVY